MHVQADLTPDPSTVRLDSPDETTRSASVPVDGPVTVVVGIRSGSVGIDADGPDGSVEIAVGSLNDAARYLLDSVRVLHADGTVSVPLPHDRGGLVGGRTPDFALTVRMPAGSGLRVSAASADVTGTGRAGEVEVSTASGDVDLAGVASGRVAVASGDVRIADAAGALDVRSASGDVSVVRVGGEARVQSASGDVRIGAAEGPASLESASGDVRIGRVDGRLTTRTASGEVTVGSLLGPDARITTVSGDVEVGVPDGTAVWLDVSTRSGEVASDFTGSAAGDGGEPGAGDRVLELRVSTVSGDVAVRRT